jgi:hypothetical protein
MSFNFFELLENYKTKNILIIVKEKMRKKQTSFKFSVSKPFLDCKKICLDNPKFSKEHEVGQA